jgi:probable rRNA maturation factor
MIQFLNEKTQLPAFNQSTLRNWIRKVAATHGKIPGEVNFMFCDDEKILEVNRQYLQHDYYTDIITFNYSSGSIISGDIYISVDTVTTNAMLFKVGFDHELFRVIIHGVLHLCGYDDNTPETREKMTQLENEALKNQC